MFFLLKFVEHVFVSSLFNLASSFDLASRPAYIISSHVIAETPIIFPKYFPFWQLHVAGFQI